MTRSSPIRFVRALSLCSAVLLSSFALAQDAESLKALVGGRLIDGFGGEPIENSVILVRGERIRASNRPSSKHATRSR